MKKKILRGFVLRCSANPERGQWPLPKTHVKGRTLKKAEKRKKEEKPLGFGLLCSALHSAFSSAPNIPAPDIVDQAGEAQWESLPHFSAMARICPYLGRICPTAAKGRAGAGPGGEQGGSWGDPPGDTVLPGAPLLPAVPAYTALSNRGPGPLPPRRLLLPGAPAPSFLLRLGFRASP